MSCLFCQIVAEQIPAEIVARNDDALAFRDINPQAPIHVLVIPRRHVPNLVALAGAATELQAVVALAGEVAAAESLSQGYRLVANTGEHGQQSVDHAHLHVVGGRQMQWPPG